MRAIDTNVLIRILTRDHREQAEVADDFVAAGAWVSHVVLVETVWVLESVYHVKPRSIAAALEKLLEHESLVLQDADVVASALAVFRKRLSLGFTDCLIVEISRKVGHGPLGTFDAQLAKLDGAVRLSG